MIDRDQLARDVLLAIAANPEVTARIAKETRREPFGFAITIANTATRVADSLIRRLETSDGVCEGPLPPAQLIRKIVEQMKESTP